MDSYIDRTSSSLTLAYLILATLIRRSVFVALLLLLDPFQLLAKTPPQKTSVSPAARFTSISKEVSGITFNNQLRENRQMNIIAYHYYHNGGGVAVGDINSDGLEDIFFTGNLVPNKLYLNRGGFRFEDVTARAGVAGDGGWSTGVTMADVNGDGLLDIYVCRSAKFPVEQRRNQLFMNQGKGVFQEQAAKYGIDDPSYSTQASFFDYDRDGDLDLFLLNHSVEEGQSADLNTLKNERDPYVGDKLYRNDNGNFTEVSEAAGIRSNAIGYGLGVSAADLNNDGWPDIYVANDFLEHDYLYINNQDGTFQETIKATTGHISNFGMGVDTADYNNDGLIDIFVADMAAADNYRQKANMSGMNPEVFWKSVDAGFHYQYMINTLQLNNGDGTYSEASQLAGVSNTDWSWAALFADFDNDGWKDLFVSNGLRREARNNDFVKLKKQFAERLQTEKDFDTDAELQLLLQKMPRQKLRNYMFRNGTDLQFLDVTAEWGLSEETFSNGAAYADFDNDGDLDLVVNNIDDPALLYRNETSGQNYLQVILQGEGKNPFAIGARVSLYVGGETQVLEQFPTRGYQSAVSSVLHFGLGKNREIDSLEVRWPNGALQKVTDVSVNQRIVIKKESNLPIAAAKSSPSRIFKTNAQPLQIDYRHRENDFDDFDREVLLPHKLSTQGPALSVADVNGDGFDDFYAGGAKGYSGALYLQQPSGEFLKSSASLWEQEKGYEDVDSIFFDADSDGDLDLYVVSGGNDFDAGDKLLQDRLYLNNGKGVFVTSNKLPALKGSGSTVRAADFDQDGDLDLFVGNRGIAGSYPLPASSHLLVNEGGRFVDVTKKLAPSLEKIGLVTDALWSDFDGDKKLDLIVVGEWMSIVLLKNNGKTFQDVSKQHEVEDATGWWFSIAESDYDKDGDLDYVIGNLGLNYKFKASEEEPFEVFASDFDDNGQLDIVLSYYDKGELFPVRGRECASQQIPMIQEEFVTYDSYAQASIADIFPELDQKKPLHLSATTFATSLLENRGAEGFVLRPLPSAAQLSSVNAILSEDFNGDGHVDLLLAGNLYGSEVETPRNDASYGLVLLGDGSGNFNPLSAQESGFSITGDVRHLSSIRLVKKGKAVLVARNAEPLLASELH